jgi:hypothetical protein
MIITQYDDTDEPHVIAAAIERACKDHEVAKAAGDDDGMREAWGRLKVWGAKRAAIAGVAPAPAADLTAARARVDAGDRSTEAIAELFNAGRGVVRRTARRAETAPTSLAAARARVDNGDRSPDAIAGLFRAGAAAR